MGLRRTVAAVADPPAPWVGERWEYQFVDVSKRNAKTLAELNRLGAEGWELVAVGSPAKGETGVFSASSLVGVLKRPAVG
jgi:hypothetical protein